MKIERYNRLLVVLVVGLFLVNASWPQATFANVQAPTAPTNIQCPAPVNTWCVPATAGAGVLGTFCSTSAPIPAPVKPESPAVKDTSSPWEVLGTILAAPFVIGQCIFGACP
jgi:hypothetical protein